MNSKEKTFIPITHKNSASGKYEKVLKIFLPSAGHDVFSYGQVGFWNGEAGRLATVLSQRNPFQNVSMLLPDSVGMLKQEK